MAKTHTFLLLVIALNLTFLSVSLVHASKEFSAVKVQVTRSLHNIVEAVE